MFLALEGVCRRRGRTQVLEDITFGVDQGQIVSIIGPSGVGKTTLLEIIAGLDAPDKGGLTFGTPPSREHPVILVHQDFMLFPNLTVYGNTAFGLTARRTPKAEVHRRVMAMLEYFHMADRGDSYPHQLSAGQKQRVAIARAMVVEPMLLLLDEPFANLDRNLKMSTAEFLRQTQRNFGVTTIAATHDLEEALAMSDRIGLLLDGRLAQYAPAHEIYHYPANREAGEFLGPVNEIGPGIFHLLDLPENTQPDQALLVRPECIELAAAPDGSGLITDVAFIGHYTKYRVELDGTTLQAYGQFGSITAGQRVSIRIRPCPGHREVP
ncbi:MAG: ABC transporter ATP-binding protein [Pseudomonadota bacterium]